MYGFYLGLKWFGAAKPSNFTLNEVAQAKIDSLRAMQGQKDPVKIFPFNPNYISDYKGYTLGMSPDEIDRLHIFRKSNRYVNSSEEFQTVTKVSDSLLGAISPYFKFPDWVNARQSKTFKKVEKNYEGALAVRNLNEVTVEDLKKINGIGEVLSARIIKFRNRLGGFLVDEQLYDVYGLEPQVAQRVLQRFQVRNPPQIQKININVATVEELSSLIYISKELAQKIVSYRNTNGNFMNLNDLLNISGYPQNKNERIKLYLSI